MYFCDSCDCWVVSIWFNAIVAEILTSHFPQVKSLMVVMSFLTSAARHPVCLEDCISLLEEFKAHVVSSVLYPSRLICCLYHAIKQAFVI